MTKAQSGQFYEWQEASELRRVAGNPAPYSFSVLIAPNLALFEQRLFAVVARTPAAPTVLPNGQW